MGMGSRDCVLVLWLLTMLLTLHSRSRMRRLKLSGTVQGLVQEPVALDDRTMHTLCAARRALRWEKLRLMATCPRNSANMSAKAHKVP